MVVKPNILGPNNRQKDNNKKSVFQGDTWPGSVDEQNSNKHHVRRNKSIESKQARSIDIYRSCQDIEIYPGECHVATYRHGQFLIFLGNKNRISGWLRGTRELQFCFATTAFQQIKWDQKVLRLRLLRPAVEICSETYRMHLARY